MMLHDYFASAQDLNIICFCKKQKQNTLYQLQETTARYQYLVSVTIFSKAGKLSYTFFYLEDANESKNCWKSTSAQINNSIYDKLNTNSIYYLSSNSKLTFDEIMMKM